jgi:tetratricopeptide (TPR) repeat protein
MNERLKFMPLLTFSCIRARLCSILILLPILGHACIWDADTLADERRAKPALADLILNETPARPDPKPFRDRIAKLKAEPRDNDPAWWSDLAGAHLRLGEAAEAAKILEPLVSKFPNDYGIHANLGTAYHLLGRYADAERHIARDLEINPEAHFGLETYHLALLRYLNRDAEFQKEHVYIEAWTDSLHREHDSAYGSLMPEEELSNKFDAQFLNATNLLEGVMYMAQLNSKQPACWVMLGLVCIKHGQRDLNLGKTAFERAIRLGSPQKELLEPKIAAIEEHIRKARANRYGDIISIIVTLALFVGVLGLGIACIAWRRNLKSVRNTAKPT